MTIASKMGQTPFNPRAMEAEAKAQIAEIEALAWQIAAKVQAINGYEIIVQYDIGLGIVFVRPA